jgi:hypothetical protein
MVEFEAQLLKSKEYSYQGEEIEWYHSPAVEGG